jgi:hypothetical protein
MSDNFRLRVGLYPKEDLIVVARANVFLPGSEGQEGLLLNCKLENQLITGFFRVSRPKFSL